MRCLWSKLLQTQDQGGITRNEIYTRRAMTVRKLVVFYETNCADATFFYAHELSCQLTHPSLIGTRF